MKNQRIKQILSACIFLASVGMYLLAVNNFIENTEIVAFHRYVFVGLSLLYFAAFLVPLARLNGYIRPIRWKSRVWTIIWNILYFFGMIFVATIMEELLWNDRVMYLFPRMFVLNCGIVLVLALVLVLWIPKIWIAYTLLLVVSFVYGLVNHFVYYFKGCPPMFNDIFAAKTAATVMGSYTYTIDRRIAYGGVLLLVALASLAVIAPEDLKRKGKSWKGTVAVWAVRVVVPLLLVFGICRVDIGKTFDLGIDGWAPVFSFRDHGAPVTMLMSYQFSKPEKPEGIAGYLRDVQGYDTVAFHPFVAENWNRPEAYDALGFDTFLTQEDVTEPEYLAQKISDASDYGLVEDLLDEREDKPMFLFNVTMQNHGGYSLDMFDRNTEPIAMDSAYSGYQDVVTYLTLMRESDLAFDSFLEYLKQIDTPVIVCLFGDHQPALDDEFLNAITIQDGENAVARQQKLQMTPYMIWANYDTGIEQTELDMSINYLGANLMNVAGYHTAYNAYLLDLQQAIPVVNACGYQTADGRWHSIDEPDASLEEYRLVQYYELFHKDQ